MNDRKNKTKQNKLQFGFQDNWICYDSHGEYRHATHELHAPCALATIITPLIQRILMPRPLPTYETT